MNFLLGSGASKNLGQLGQGRENKKSLKNIRQEKRNPHFSSFKPKDISQQKSDNFPKQALKANSPQLFAHQRHNSFFHQGTVKSDPNLNKKKTFHNNQNWVDNHRKEKHPVLFNPYQNQKMTNFAQRFEGQKEFDNSKFGEAIVLWMKNKHGEDSTENQKQWKSNKNEIQNFQPFQHRIFRQQPLSNTRSQPGNTAQRSFYSPAFPQNRIKGHEQAVYNVNPNLQLQRENHQIAMHKSMPNQDWNRHSEPRDQSLSDNGWKTGFSNFKQQIGQADWHDDRGSTFRSRK